MMKRWTFAILLFCFLFHPEYSPAAPRFLVLSGGGDPVHNNYSQYLQTKALADFLRKKFGKKNVDVMFGAGNGVGKAGLKLPDVNAKLRDAKTGTVRAAMVYGAIKDNRPGTKPSVVSYFENELPGKLSPDDAFFLFVSDHGLPNPETDDYGNNCIHLWAYEPESDEEPSWREQCLSKDELKGLIARRVPARRTVFAMSQCYSGGFHQMSVDESGRYPSADPRVCGFTSVPEDLMASGCTDDVEADQYQGYERYFTEELSGRDVVTGNRLRGGYAKTVNDADARAVLRDATIDVPMSTADYYLQAWYYALWEDGFMPRSGRFGTKTLRDAAGAVTGRAWDDATLIAKSGALGGFVKERLASLKSRVRSLAGFHPEWEGTFERGAGDDLDGKTEELQKRLDTLDAEYVALAEKYWRLRYQKLFKPWLAAIKAGQVRGLSDEEKNDEVSFFGELENQFRADPQTDLGIEQAALLELSVLTAKDPERAGRFASYMADRDAKMLAWAESSGDLRLMETAIRLKGLNAGIDAGDAPSEDVSRRISHLRRIVQMRQELAAAVALGMMGDAKAIDELRGLEECQRTPF